MELLEAVEIFSENSARFRYRVPVSFLSRLQYEGSLYSPEFEVGGWLWRFHIQERQLDGERFLALHLQSCTSGAVQAHFKLTVVCMRDPLLSRSKAFQCTFKRAGSAWGLHQFLPMSTLLDATAGFVYEADEAGVRCVDFGVTLQVEPREGEKGEKNGGSERGSGVNGGGGGVGVGSFAGAPEQRPPLPSLRPSIAPRPEERPFTPSFALVGETAPMPVLSRASSVRPRTGPGSVYGGAGLPDNAGGGAVARRKPSPAALAYPFDHLEVLSDMTFDVQGVRVKAHRCVVGARMSPLLPAKMLPLQVGCVVSIAVPLDVFRALLRYVYTEESPDQEMLPPESLLDLYLLSTACEFYDLSSTCIQYVQPLLTQNNILPIVLTRYNAADEVLTSLYLRVLLDHYDSLITDTQFEEIPGHLFRRLSLIMYQKETVPRASIPAMKNTLAKQLAWLAETGEYSDYDWVVGPQRHVIRTHRFILASRSGVFSQAVNPRNPAPLPDFSSSDFDFTLHSWQRFILAMYARHLDAARDFAAEDIAIIYKMQSVLSMDGHLKRESDDAFDGNNALRLLIYAVKHNIQELHERAVSYVAANFNTLIRTDPQAWELIGDLPRAAILSLFRTVTEHQR